MAKTIVVGPTRSSPPELQLRRMTHQLHFWVTDVDYKFISTLPLKTNTP